MTGPGPPRFLRTGCGALVVFFFSLGLRGCGKEEHPACVLKELWAASFPGTEIKDSRFDTSEWKDLTEKMPEDCCNALRGFLTEKHQIDPAKFGGSEKPEDELKEGAGAKQATEQTGSDAKAAADAIAKDDLAKGKSNVDPADATKATDATTATGKNANQDAIIKSDAMAKLMKQFHDSFCHLECPSKVEENGKIKKTTEEVCKQKTSFIEAMDEAATRKDDALSSFLDMSVPLHPLSRSVGRWAAPAVLARSRRQELVGDELRAPYAGDTDPWSARVP